MSNKKQLFSIIFLFTLVAFVAGYRFQDLLPKTNKSDALNNFIPTTEKVLDIYSQENLANTKIEAGQIVIGEMVKEENNFSSYYFSFKYHPQPKQEEFKTVSGLLNIPKTGKANQKMPLIIMLRGYVDQKNYETGMGTNRAGEYFASNGFLTIAPDFLGYGSSDKEAENIFESRFQTYTAVLSLLLSLDSIGEYDQQNLFFWGHSNGGQIALTVLEISQKDIPAALWAPVSKPFPYSILYYTDESDDKGKFIRSELARFETDYDVEKYSLDNYLGRIKTSLQIHQGTADDAVPLDWSKQLSQKLDNLEIKNRLYFYPGADHNLQPAWKTVVQRDLDFFTQMLR